MHVLAPLSDPEWHPRMERHGMPWDDATALVDRLIAETRATALREAADFVGNDDDCGCGGCDSCVPRKLADQLRAKADEIHPAPADGATA
jgi:hypothetical protein